MKNQVLPGAGTCRRFCVCPTTVKAGDPVLVGKMPAVALDDYSTLSGGSTFLFSGSFALTVKALSALSPPSGLAINQGDKVYADTDGTLGLGNVTTGFTIDVNSATGTFFGYLDPQYQKTILTTATDTAAWVKLAGSE